MLNLSEFWTQNVTVQRARADQRATLTEAIQAKY